MLGDLCREIQKKQSRKLYVMAENVVITDEKDRNKISEAFGFKWDPIVVDLYYIKKLCVPKTVL